MPDEPLINLIRDELVTIAEDISKANGYWLDYGDVVAGAVADWDAEKDFERPRIFIAYDGEESGDAIVGAETATMRFRRHERFMVTVAVKDNDPEWLLQRIRADLHKAFIDEDGRFLTNGRGAIFEAGSDWLAWPDVGVPIGGALAVTYVVRWEHVSGDMSST